MITLITNREQIENSHTRFHKQLSKFFTENVRCWVGYPSGSFEDTIKYSPRLEIWISQQSHENKFWNGFGVGRPIEGKNNSLSGEINFPYEGIHRRIAGAFGIEDNGNILVLHRGKIGGGRPGIGKNYFTDRYRGDFITAIDGDRETEFCLVGELSSKHFPTQVASFIKEIYRVKHVDKSGTTVDFENLLDFEYTEERFGQSITERNDPVIINRTHGLIVRELAQRLTSRGFLIGNDKNRDLFIYKRNRITTLFEIKTSSSTQCLYSAVGQLLLYSIPISNPVHLVAVLPTKLSRKVTERFYSLGINILYFNWNNDELEFLNLDEVIESLGIQINP